MTIAREEIFGPVVGVIPFEDEAEAIGSPTTPPTGSPPGSGPATSRAPTGWRRRWRPARSGSTPTTSSTRRSPSAASGDSGLGRDLGDEALYAFTELKSVVIAL